MAKRTSVLYTRPTQSPGRCTLSRMRSLLIILTILTLMQCSKNDVATFETQTKHIFFNAEIDKSGEDLYKFYKSSDFLSLDPPSGGYTLYPALSALGAGGRTDYHTFRFRKHPYLDIAFREGELIITSRDKNNIKDYSEPVLKFFFDTKQQMELAYNQLTDIYTKLSTRKRFSSYKDTKNAEFTDDNSKSVKDVGFLQGNWDELAKGYVIVFGLGNDLDIDKQD